GLMRLESKSAASNGAVLRYARTAPGRMTGANDDTRVTPTQKAKGPRSKSEGGGNDSLASRAAAAPITTMSMTRSLRAMGLPSTPASMSEVGLGRTERRKGDRSKRSPSRALAKRL